MKRRTLEEIVLLWAPEDGDRYGEDKKKFIRKNNLFEIIEEKCIFTRVFPY
ncbi:hypothetical protein [Leptospira noguchii]|uniref:Uncharacterized protein n=2 Tax=Leptospira noguchii TaxID=28182 RepID=T0FHE3_9LEPT|nr:hypothetical protein [Leptospira noguchii]EMO54254.1 hypothetical protein LEP1GSC172_3861 [Leptospira noguchii]EQA72708.1 hypothetical protein LEP1GSC059_2439 [Leptospira noguchii serovar Panama str. CZ214]